jgi:hypothetical protein
MAYIDVSRTATSAADISIGWEWTVYPTNLVPFVLKVGKVDGSVGGHMGWSGTWSMSMTNTVRNRPGNPWSWQILLTVNVANGNGQTATNTITVASGTETVLDYRDVSGTITGSWSASVATNVLWNITETAYSVSSAPTQFPPHTTYDVYEQAKPSATCTATLTLAGTGTTATGTVGAGGGATATYDFTAGLTQRCEDTGTASSSITNIKVNTITPYQATHSHSYDRQTAGNWSTTGTSYATEATDVVLTSSARLAANVGLAARMRAWEGAYPDSLTVRVTGFDYETTGYRDITGTGSIAGTDVFYKYSFVSNITTSGGSSSLTTALNGVPTYISAAITTASLTANGDSSSDTRVLFRGWRFNGWSIAETNNRAISGTGNDRLYAPYEGMSGYRYLDIQIKAQSGTNQTGYIELTDYHGNTKRWQVVAPTTSYSTVTLDLCSPDIHSLGALPATDDKDNPYPRKNTASSSYAGSESVDSAYWGITSCQRLRVSSGSIDIGTTTLKYTNTDSTYVPDSFTAAFERITPAIVAEVDTTTYYYGRRFWQQDRDGRTEEESDVWWQMTVGGETGVTSYSVDPVTISELAGQINASDDSIVRHPGWTATNSVAYPAGATCSVSQPPLRDCFLNGVTGYSTWLRGGGILATPNATSGTDFAYGHQLAQGTITAQTLFDRINGNFPPDLYDPFDVNGGTDSALYLAGGSLLRGIAHGAVLDDVGDPATTGTVDLELASTGANRGTDSTLDAEGRFYTSTPWGLGESNHDAISGSNNIGIDPLHTSHRFRCWFRTLTAAGGCLSVDVAPNQRLCYANVESHTVVLHFADGPNATNFVSVTTPITSVDCVAIAYDPTSQSGRLYILVEKQSGGGIDSYYTDDEGATVSMATVVSAAGTHVSVAINPMGKRCVVFRYTGNDLHRVIYDPQGNIITASSAVVASGVQNDQTAISWRLGNWYLYYHSTSAGITQLVSVDDGETFA